MPISYETAIANLTNGNVTEAVIMSYTIPLGSIAWLLLIFATMMATYIKTQSTGLSALVGMLSISALQGYTTYFGTPILNDGMFFIIIVLGLAVLLFNFWKSR